jgi:hypothetical protein
MFRGIHHVADKDEEVEMDSGDSLWKVVYRPLVVGISVILGIMILLVGLSGPPQPWTTQGMNAFHKHFVCLQLAENVSAMSGRLEMLEKERIEPDPMFREICATYRGLNEKWCKGGE